MLETTVFFIQLVCVLRLAYGYFSPECCDSKIQMLCPVVLCLVSYKGDFNLVLYLNFRPTLG